MPTTIDGAGLVRLLQPGMRVYVTGTAGESCLIAEMLRTGASALNGVDIVGVWLPGINAIDYAAFAEGARSTTFFITGNQRRSYEAGKISLVPLAYSAAYRYLESGPAFDLAILHVSPPDADGMVSVGIANDFQPAAIANAVRLFAHVNPRMPITMGAARVPISRFDGVVEGEAPLLCDQAVEDPTWDAIGTHIASVVEDGDTLELGIGRVQSVWRCLQNKRRLRVHSGAISSPLLELVAAGALADHADAVITGIAHGTAALHDFAARDNRVRFAPVGWTHHPATLGAIPRFTAINSVIEVDLLGQANAETVDGRQIGGAGGLTDFMRGARLSEGGRSIIALPATARGGNVSRIVAELAPGAPVSVSRAEADLVITEFGIADLRLADIDRRAQSLIGIAAPDFRGALGAAWEARRRAM